MNMFGVCEYSQREEGIKCEIPGITDFSKAIKNPFAGKFKAL